MADGNEDQAFAQAVKRNRDALLDQIKQSKHAINRSNFSCGSLDLARGRWSRWPLSTEARG
jgi:hypothetical protein